MSTIIRTIVSVGYGGRLVESLRKVGDKESAPERRYYISSRMMPAADFAKAVRAHWGIENRVHWMLDVNFREDAATVRKDHAAENLSRLKRIVLNVLKVETATASFSKISLARNASSPPGTTTTGWRSWGSNRRMTDKCDDPGLVSREAKSPLITFDQRAARLEGTQLLGH